MFRDPPPWYEQAACNDFDPEIFFDPQRYGEAKKICATCPVKAECLDHAIDTGENFGVWGGETPEGRRRIKKARER